MLTAFAAACRRRRVRHQGGSARHGQAVQAKIKKDGLEATCRAINNGAK
jgi:hypothetical protein